MRLVGAEAVLAPEVAALPADASGEWFGAGTGWGYAERIGVHLSGQDAGMLPHAEDLLTAGAVCLGAWRGNSGR